MKKLGISIYPEKTTKERLFEYLDKASECGFSRIFSCLLSVTEEKEKIKETFREINLYAKSKGFEYIPSYTNFITIKFADKFVSKEVAQKLLERGVIVRDLTGYGQNAIRITIGRNEQNTKVFEQLDEVLENLK